MNIIGSFGVKVIQSVDALQETETPVKEHVWDGKKETLSYHKRVQKKWVKRWGMVMEPAAHETPWGLVCHPTIYNQIALLTEDRGRTEGKR